MSAEKEETTSRLDNAVSFSRGFLNPGGAPDALLDLYVSGNTNPKPQTETTSTENTPKPKHDFKWGIYSAIAAYIKGELK